MYASAWVKARATDSTGVAPACCICDPDTLIGLNLGTSWAQYAITSAVSRSAASTRKQPGTAGDVLFQRIVL